MSKPEPELRTWEQIIERYGGDCTYQLIAQCGKTHRFSGYSEKIYLPAPASLESNTPSTAEPRRKSSRPKKR